MKRKFVVVTGGSGSIASVIFMELREVFSFTFLDCVMPNQIGKKVFNLDVANDYDGLKQHLQNKDAVIHLGWNTRVENWKSDRVAPENKLMAENVYRAAVEAKVPRLIMASSIHADARFYKPQTPFGLSPNQGNPVPDSLYGVSKLYVEALGRYYCATKYGLEVICIRFGGVTLDNQLREEPLAEKIWLHTQDCASLINACIDAPSVPENFCIVNGVSNNTGRVHAWSNPFGWVPKHDFAK